MLLMMLYCADVYTNNLLPDYCPKCKRRNTEEHKVARGDDGGVCQGRCMNQPPMTKPNGLHQKTQLPEKYPEKQPNWIIPAVELI